MALQKAFPIPRFGIDATYHRVEGAAVTYGAVPKLDGAKGFVDVTLAGYASRATRDANAPSIGKRTIRLYFGADCADAIKIPYTKLKGYQIRVVDGVEQDCPVTEVLPETPISTIKSDDPTRAQIYEAIAAMGAFEGAESV